MNKAEINQLVNKVREVVNNVSTNDIVLALHSFDMNVERTIQAFCEDGASGVLDDWVRPSGAKKNKKKKNASEQSKSESSVSSVHVSAPKVVEQESSNSSAPSTRKEAAVNGKPSTVQPVSKTPTVSKPSPEPKDQLHKIFSALRDALSQKEQALRLQSGSLSKVSADADHILALINKLGSAQEEKPRTEKPAVSPSNVSSGIKHATSQSSISSSVGADSGVNLSPTHQENKPKKESKAVKVASGGINMSSDALSEDQLAALQRSLQEQLAARGIDPSVVSAVTDMPTRRPRKPTDKKNQKDKPANRPQLSILNNA